MTESNTQNTTVTPQQERAPTPLVSAAQLEIEDHPIIHVPEGRRYALREHAKQIADTWRGSRDQHYLGLLGEAAVTQFLDINEAIDVDVYPDGGDGGIDFQYQGASIDVKTVGRQRCNPALTVNVRDSLNADYYALVSRIGTADFRLIGYTPRYFVANAPTLRYENNQYHIVEQEYLFPFQKPTE